jgi:hypothetical protein
MKFKVHHKTKTFDLDDPTEPSAYDIANGNFKSLLIEIDELSINY